MGPLGRYRWDGGIIRQEPPGGLEEPCCRALPMDGMREFTPLDDAVRGSEEVVAGAWIGEADRERRVVEFKRGGRGRPLVATGANITGTGLASFGDQARAKVRARHVRLVFG